MTETPLAIDISIGKRLRFRRGELGLTGRGLAEKVGVSAQQISKYELGHYRLYASKLFEISGALDVPVTYFFEGLAGVDDSFNRELIELAKGYRKISDAETRKKVRDLVGTLAPSQQE